jgi:hypothetical protein
MIKLRIAAGAALLAVAGTAVGGNVSATVALTSDYDFRGRTQTLNDPAFQLGITYTGDVGIYYGVWGSTVDFSNGDNYDSDRGLRDLDRPSTEVDLFVGFSGEKWVGYDLGFIYYTYPNAHQYAQGEVYAGITKGPLSLKVWYSSRWTSTGDNVIYYDGRSSLCTRRRQGCPGDGAVYTEGNINASLAEGFSFLGHFGLSNTSDWTSFGNYYDWSIGFGYSASNFNLTMKYIDGNELDTLPGLPQNLGRFVFGVSTNLPWGN